MAEIKAQQIIQWARENGFEFEYFGDTDAVITGVSSLKKYRDGCITWIKRKAAAQLEEGILPRIRCCVIQRGVEKHPENYFVTDHAKLFFFSMAEHFFADRKGGPVRGQNTWIGEHVTLGQNVRIGCGCILDGVIHIGDNTVIGHNVTIVNRVTIGSSCVIQSGAVIGEDGFGFAYDSRSCMQPRVPHFGGVVIGDQVEIGCHTVVNRGTLDEIDSLTIVAHNVTVGSDTVIVGGATLGGSCTVGQRSYIAPHATIKNQVHIGSDVFVGMDVVVSKDIGDGCFVARTGDAPRNIRDYRRFL